MLYYLFLPMYFLAFWFGEAPLKLLSYFHEINKAYFQFFSASLLLRTFFKPVKNEYRKGLVGFSIGMGIFLKSCLLITAALLFIPLVLAECVFLIGFLAFPLFMLAILIW